MSASPPIDNMNRLNAERAITALIVTHQSEQDLDRCLGSLKRAAKRSEITILAWDNASSDQSIAKLRAAGVSVTASKENIGFGNAVNKLAQMVETPFIFLLNPDAAPAIGAIDALVDAAQSMPDRDMFCGTTVFSDGATNFTSAWGKITPFSAAMSALGVSRIFQNSKRLNPETLPDWDRLSDREVDIATGCALLIRTYAWRALGGFDPRYWLYGEEADLQLRMVEAGGKRPWFVSDAKCIHDNGAVIPSNAALKNNVFRKTAILRGRATLMKTRWRGWARLTAQPILATLAFRYRVMAFVGGQNGALHLRLWQTRKDWMDGYPEPSQASGAQSRGQRM